MIAVPARVELPTDMTTIRLLIGMGADVPVVVVIFVELPRAIWTMTGFFISAKQRRLLLRLVNAIGGYIEGRGMRWHLVRPSSISHKAVVGARLSIFQH